MPKAASVSRRTFLETSAATAAVTLVSRQATWVSVTSPKPSGRIARRCRSGQLLETKTRPAFSLYAGVATNSCEGPSTLQSCFPVCGSKPVTHRSPHWTSCSRPAISRMSGAL